MGGILRSAFAWSCLFLSGFAALLYEVCWIRTAAKVFGSTTLALSTVLAAYFLGLALGNHLVGRLTPRLRDPMRLYVALELAIAVLALASPWVFELADLAYASAYPSLERNTGLLTFTRFALVSVVLVPATIAMGGTLPLFCRAFVTSSKRVAGDVGWLYAANTLGGAAGVLVTGLALLPAIGVRGAIALGAALSTVAAAVAAVGLRSSAFPSENEPIGVRSVEKPAAHRASTPGPWTLATLVFGLGFASLAGEVMWTRYLGLLEHSTVSTYTVSLSVVLLGIVLGALAARAWDGRLGNPAFFGALQVAAGLYVLAMFLQPPSTWKAMGNSLSIKMVLLLPPAVLSGTSLPMAMRWAIEDPKLAGMHVGRLTAINLVGGVAGSLVLGFSVLPGLGLHAGALVVSGASLALGVIAWLATRRRLMLIPASAAILLWLALPPGTSTRVPGDFLTSGATLVQVHEGLASNVAVLRRDGIRQLEIDRWWQGQNGRTHQIMAAHVPMLFAPDARRVMVVGVGTGQTASRFLMYPIDALDAVDIEPAVFEVVARSFDSDWMRDPRVRLVRDDGRNVLAHTSRRYDLISLELGQLFRPGVETFYTDEFYRRAAQRLEPGGILCQFVPISFLTFDQFRRVIGTFVKSFPEAVLWYNTAELLLIGRRDGPLKIGPAALERIRNDPRLREDLRYSHWGGPAHALSQPHVMLGGFLVGAPRLAELSHGAPPLRDDRPMLEYETPKALGRESGEPAIVSRLERWLDPPTSVMDSTVANRERPDASSIRRLNLGDLVASARLREAEALAPSGDYGAVLVKADEAVLANPSSVRAHRFRGDALVYLRRLDEARSAYGRALAIEPDDPIAHRGLGAVCLMQGRPEESEPHLAAALAAYPEDSEAHHNLGVALAQRGDFAAAERHFERAVELRPENAEARSNLERARIALRSRR